MATERTEIWREGDVCLTLGPYGIGSSLLQEFLGPSADSQDANGQVEIPNAARLAVARALLPDGYAVVRTDDAAIESLASQLFPIYDDYLAGESNAQIVQTKVRAVLAAAAEGWG